MVRLFVAVWPPSTVLDAVSALPRPPIDGLRWTSPDQWHVTLRFFGSVPVPAVESVRAACHRIDIESATRGVESAGGGEVEAVMGPTTGRFGSRILQVPISGLDGLAAATVAATAAMGEPPDPRPFAGHLTLARSRGRHEGDVDLRPLCGIPLAASWLVTELTLVASHLGAGSTGGARYEVIERLPLWLPG
ncbi:MAG: hypothetical protein QOG03_2141 [Actinomycetota bacterium]|nr:hypothetical protein [Actinomycetota bacterium]